MSHIYNAGYAVVSNTTDPNSVTALQSGHTIKLAVSEDGTTIWKFVEGNPLGEKWVPALPDNVALKDEDETITGTWTFNNVINAPGGTSTEWNTAYDRSITGASFNTLNGVYRITRQDGSNVDTDLDGRWLLFENWDTNNTDIDGLTLGSTFGKLIEGSGAGHFVLGIRSNDDNDAFYILATDNADYTGDYTEKLFEVSKNRIQYKGDNIARQGVNNNFSVGQSIIGSLDVTSYGAFNNYISNSADTYNPLRLTRTGTTENINIELTHAGGTRYLGMASDETLRWGSNSNSSLNDVLATQNWVTSQIQTVDTLQEVTDNGATTTNTIEITKTSGDAGLVLKTTDSAGGNNSPFIKWENTTTSLFTRMSASGNLQIYNNALASNILSLTQSGDLDVTGQIKGTDLQINLVGSDTAKIQGDNDAQLRLIGTDNHWSGIGFIGSTGTQGYLYYNSINEYFQFTQELRALDGLDVTGTLDVVNPISVSEPSQLNLSSVTTDSSLKDTRISFSHYLNAEEKIGLIAGRSDLSTSRILIGGGRAELNAATAVEIYAAANNSTLTGSKIVDIDINGVDITGTLDVTGNVTAPNFIGNVIAQQITNASTSAFQIRTNGGVPIATFGDTLTSTFNGLVSANNGLNVTGANLEVTNANLAINNGEFEIGTGATPVGYIRNVSGRYTIEGATSRSIDLGSETFGTILSLDGVNGGINVTGTLDVSGHAYLDKNGTGGQRALYFQEDGVIKSQITSNYNDDKFYIFHNGNKIVLTQTEINLNANTNITGTLDVSGNISTTNGFAQFVRNADATTPITLLKLQNQFTGQDVAYDFKLGSSKELIIEGTSASSKIISSQPVEITGTLDVNGDVTISKDNPSIIIDDNLGGRSVSIGLVNNEFRIKDVANNASVFVVDLSQNPTVLDVKAITTFERNVTFDQDIDVTGTLDVSGLSTLSGGLTVQDSTIKVGSSTGANAVDSGTIDFLEDTDADFGSLNGYGFRLNYNGDTNDFTLKSGSDTTVTNVFRVDRGATATFEILRNTEITGTLNVTDGTDSVEMYYAGIMYKRNTSYLRPDGNGTRSLFIGGPSQSSADWNNVYVYTNGTTDFKWNDEIVATQDWIQAQGYITSQTDSQTLSWNSANNALSISNGNTVNINTFGSGVTISTTLDQKLVLRAPSGDTTEWNYMGFVGTDGVRDGFFGVDSVENLVWNRDTTNNSIYLKADGTNEINGDTSITGTLDVSNGTDSIEVRGDSINFSRVAASYIRPTANGTHNLYIGNNAQGVLDWSNVYVYTNGSDDFKWNDETVATQDWVTSNIDEDIIDGAYSIWDPDGSGGDVFNYNDNNPTINGQYVGATIYLKGDGNIMDAMLQTDIFNGLQFSASQGFYVGGIFDRTTTTQTSTQVIDGSGNWVGNEIDSTKLPEDRYVFTNTTGTGGSLDTRYRAEMFAWSPTTTGTKPSDSYGQGISIVSSGHEHNDLNNWITQLGFGTSKDTAYFRTKVNDESWGSWYELLHSGNFVAGTDYASASHTHSATDITSGTLSDTRLSSNVALKNVNNLFTARQRIEFTATAAASIISSSNTLELYSNNTGDSSDYISMLFHHGSQTWGAIRYNNVGFHFTDGDDLDYRDVRAKDFYGTTYKIGGATILSGSSTVQLGSAGATGFINLSTTSGNALSISGLNSTFGGDVKIIKDEPWLTLDSSNTGSNTVEQAAGISLGESGTKGTASVHLTYTGDGKGWLGMGAVTDAVPAYKALTMKYNEQRVGIGGDYSSSYNVNINGTTNFTSTINVAGTATFVGDIFANSGGIRSTAGALGFYTSGGGALPIRVLSVLASNTYSDSTKVPTNGIYSLGGIRTNKYLYAEGGGTFTSGIDSQSNVGVVINANDYIYAQLSGNYLRKLIGINGSSLEVGHPGTSLISEIVLQPGTSNIIKGEGRFQSDYDKDEISYGAFAVERSLDENRTNNARGFSDATVWNLVETNTSLGYAGFDVKATLMNGTFDHITSFQARPTLSNVTITDIEGVAAYSNSMTNSTITRMAGVYVDKPFTFDNSTITNFIGMEVAAGAGINGASITNFYGMYIGDGTVSATNKYAIFSDDSSVDVRVDGEIWAGTFRAQGEIYSPNTSTKFRVGGESSSLYLEMNAIGSTATFNDMNLKVDLEIESKKNKTTQPTSDNEFNGEIVYFGTSGTFAAGDVVTLNTSGQWVKADASAEATAYGLMGIALGTSASSNGILINGYARVSAFSGFTTGVPLFLSETAGDVTSTAPTATNTIVRVLGYKVDTNTVFFKPDNSWIKNL